MRFSRMIYYKGIKWKTLARYKLQRGIGQLDMFVIAINTAGDQLDVYPVELLKLRYYRTRPFFVVAIVRTMEDVYSYLSKLTESCINTRGDALIKEYLLNREPGVREYLGIEFNHG